MTDRDDFRGGRPPPDPDAQAWANAQAEADEQRLEALRRRAEMLPAPIPMILTCPSCCERHIDEGDFATKAHHTHACQACGMVWRPAIVPTVGVRFLPGFKNDPDATQRRGEAGR